MLLSWAQDVLLNETLGVGSCNEKGRDLKSKPKVGFLSVIIASLNMVP